MGTGIVNQTATPVASEFQESRDKEKAFQTESRLQSDEAIEAVRLKSSLNDSREHIGKLYASAFITGDRTRLKVRRHPFRKPQLGQEIIMQAVSALDLYRPWIWNHCDAPVLRHPIY
ncbi:MAG: hypothetical protein WA655_20315 [Candidatus Korobacteraceae bacterium]